ncbi:Uma2 family endonuclease [Candidatus Chloroploca sp. M-50]|uniref:Uma2 family endonuclease n=1 Tax=Candidatus Chloroploca mongolica TaxID=2528176 RepID=A0ABS4DDF0_9CHLR|nr:Uma2 family endonuclease [Candidatus Chloroploca mongolica]MBP1467462.1 Uma2 family endonuclease [Candidatus Chloroploca mongolica]
MATRKQRIQRGTTRISVPKEPIWRLQVHQYQEMIRSGILTDDDPVELLEGWLVTKMPKNPPHRVTTQITRETLAHLIPSGWYVDDQEPITTKDSEPEPDIVIIQGDRRDYLARHPYADEVALVVEVADTTLQRDRTSKKRLYARAGIPIYWIINLPERKIEVYTKPLSNAEEPDYQEKQEYSPTDTIPVILNNQIIDTILVETLFP